MPIMEAGLFIILGGIAFVFMMVSFKFGALFKLFSAIAFFTLSIFMLAGFDVAFTTETSQGNNVITDQRFIIRGGADGSSLWLGWFFVALGVFNGGLFFVEMIGMGKS